MGKISAMIFTVIALSGLSAVGYAEEKNSKKTTELEHLEAIDAFESLNETLTELSRLGNQISRQKYMACLKAFGDKRFCMCIKDKLPIAVNFYGYISIVTQTNDELKYSAASPSDKKLIDVTRKTREVCTMGDKQK